MPYGLADTQWDAARGEMRDALVRRARERRTVTYGELAAEIGAADLQPRSARFAALLNATCEDEVGEGRPMLGSLVVRKDTRVPGDGYFRCAEGIGRDAGDREAFWQAELDEVFEYWSCRQ